jgi:hypothetical protein
MAALVVNKKRNLSPNHDPVLARPAIRHLPRDSWYGQPHANAAPIGMSLIEDFSYSLPSLTVREQISPSYILYDNLLGLQHTTQS